MGIGKANKLCNLRKEGTDADDLSKAFERFGFEVEEKDFTEDIVNYSVNIYWN